MSCHIKEELLQFFYVYFSELIHWCCPNFPEEFLFRFCDRNATCHSVTQSRGHISVLSPTSSFLLSLSVLPSDSAGSSNMTHNSPIESFMSDMDPNVFGDVFGPSSSSVMNTMPSHRGHVQPTHSNSYQSQQMYYSSGFDPQARSFVENQNPLFQIVRGQITSK